MAIIEVREDNFVQEVIESKIPVLVDFWASWCGPCKMVAPVLEELAEKHPEVKVAKVNVDEQGALAMRYQIMSIPTLILFKNGAPASTSVGFHPLKELEQLIG